MSKRFENKHVLITGAARGIGYEIAVQFANEGAVLSIIDFNQETLSEATEALRSIAPTVYPYYADISKRKEVNEVVSKAESIQPVDDAGNTVYELVLIADNQVVPQTFFIPEENEVTIIQQVGGNIPISISDIAAGITVEVKTVYDLKNNIDTVESIIRTN